jgi:hypothetical protein
MQLGSSLHAFGALSAFMVVVCIWVRVAAKLHDPAGSTKKALYQLAFALDGSGIGRYIKPIIYLSSDSVIVATPSAPFATGGLLSSSCVGRPLLDGVPGAADRGGDHLFPVPGAMGSRLHRVRNFHHMWPHPDIGTSLPATKRRREHSPQTQRDQNLPLL